MPNFRDKGHVRGKVEKAALIVGLAVTWRLRMAATWSGGGGHVDGEREARPSSVWWWRPCRGCRCRGCVEGGGAHVERGV